MPSPEGMSMGTEAMSFRVGKTFLPDGTQVIISANKKEESIKAANDNGNPTNTGVHEANHAVVAIRNDPTSVIDASVVPGPGYRGITRLRRPDAIAAAAPHSHGMGGTGHDVNIIRHMGHDVGAVYAIARNIANDNKEHIHAVAVQMDKKGTLSGGEIVNIMDEVDRRKREID